MKFASVYEDPSKIIENYEVKSSINEASKPYVLIDNKIFQLPGLCKIDLEPVIWICCRDSLTLAITAKGLVYGWGKDPSGLLGQGIQETLNPKQVQGLFNIVKCSLGSNHAAAINSEGGLYTWGKEKHPKLGDTLFESCVPKQVQSAKSFSCEEVVCGDNYTCIRTGGCYVMLYGEIGYKHLVKTNTGIRKSSKGPLGDKEYLPYSHPGLDSQTVLQVTGWLNYVVVLLESREVVVFDACMQLRKLSGLESLVDYIVVTSKYVCGVGLSEVVAWSNITECKNSLECPVKIWTSFAYKVSSDFKIWTWGDDFLVVSDESNLFEADQTTDYSFFDRSPIKYSVESPLLTYSVSMEKFSPQASRESLQRLFPTGDSEKIIEKILKCRVEFSNRGTIKDAFRKIVHPIAKDAFFVMKEYAYIKKNDFLLGNTVKLFYVCEKIYKKQVYKCFYKWFRMRQAEKFTQRMEEKSQEAVNKKSLKKMNSAIEKCVGIIYRLAKKVMRNSLFDEYKSYKKYLRCIIKGFRDICKVHNKAVKRRLLDAFQLVICMNKVSFLKKQVFYKHFCAVITLVFQKKVSKSCKWVLKGIKDIQRIKKTHKDQMNKSIGSVGTRNETEYNNTPQQSQTRAFGILILKEMVIKNLKTRLRVLFPLAKNLKIDAFYKLLFAFAQLSCRRQFILRVFAFTCIKSFSGFLESFYEKLAYESQNYDDFPEFKSAYSKHELNDLIEGNSIHVCTSEISVKFPNTPKPSPHTAHNSPKYFHKPTSFRPGELLKYQKYLIKRKKLDMIEEGSSVSSYEELPYLHKIRRLRKQAANKPPWKPSSASSNFVYKTHKDSAILKGIEYYEKLIEKQARNNSVIRYPTQREEPNKNSTTKKVHDKPKPKLKKAKSKDFGIMSKKLSLSPSFYQMENESPSLISTETIVNIGLGLMILETSMKKNKKRKYRKVLKQLNLSSKAKTPVKKIPIKTPQASWKIRIMSIGAEKMKKILRLKIGKIILYKVKSFIRIY
ncbi:hypothetical protein SteCoe_2327 [Stentor coeruleus]|uniref:Uncharacterized protein n=1 Tax=Stentor coeruleus TaxID=5963 RepID=A0A1R2CZZ1_9CILI|nr:hypothetical protein SteCoe_2327 [Stentor coeruleus]